MLENHYDKTNHDDDVKGLCPFCEDVFYGCEQCNHTGLCQCEDCLQGDDE